MRPTPGARDSRLGSSPEDALSAAPMTTSVECFITTESAIDTSSETSPVRHASSRPGRRKRSVESAGRPSRSQLPSPAPTRDSITSLSSSAFDLEMESIISPHSSPRVAPEAVAESYGSESPISSASSRRNSIMASPSPQHRHAPAAASRQDDHHSQRETPPQLIMPTPVVPQRRPFSDIGKSIGKLKILVAGPSQIGKASLIQAIAHCCEDIVHVDPMASGSNREFSEVWASTRPRAWWQTELDILNSRKRRRSSTGEILDRNLCFVVRSSFHHRPSRTPEKRYIDDQLLPLLDKAMDDTDLSSILSNGGTSIVHAVFYMISSAGLQRADIECIKSMQDKTNVIPLLARSDELGEDTISSLKQRIRQQIDEHSLDFFSFSYPGMDYKVPDIFAVSSATQSDHDVMDASILMSSGYVQPLVATDLMQLVSNVFSMDGSAWLRHSAATKCIRWCREQDRGFSLHMALTHRNPALSAVTPVLTVNPFARHRYCSTIELSNWAQCLRHSLQAEQLHHLSQHRMAVESRRQGLRDLVRQKPECFPKMFANEHTNLTHQDPLGLLEIGSHIKRNGQITFELLSSLGIAGCVAAWFIQPDWINQRGLGQLSKHFLSWTVLI